MGWTYRVIKGVDDLGEAYYAVHEHYPDMGVWSESPIAAQGETLDELRLDLERQIAALDKPVLIDANGTLQEPADAE